MRAHSDTAGRRSSACVRAVCGGSGCSTQARLRFRLPSAQRPTSSPPSPPDLRCDVDKHPPPPRPPLPLRGRPPSLLFFGPAKHSNCNSNSARNSTRTLDQQKPPTHDIRHSNLRLFVRVSARRSLTFGAASPPTHALHRHRTASHRTASAPLDSRPPAPCPRPSAISASTVTLTSHGGPHTVGLYGGSAARVGIKKGSLANRG